MWTRLPMRLSVRNLCRPICEYRGFATAKLKDENAPVRPPSAYNVFVKERIPLVQWQSSEKLRATDIIKLCAQEWNVLSADDKQRYQIQVEGQLDIYKDKFKAYKETEAYEKFLKQKVARIKRDKLKQFKLPNAPKKPRSAWIYFIVENRKQKKDSNPEASLTDITKILAASWKDLTAEERIIYEEKAIKDKARYKEELERHKNSAEYHENQAGKKEYLTSLKNIKKKLPVFSEKNSKEKKAKVQAEKAKVARAKAKEKAKLKAEKERVARAKAKAKSKVEGEKAKAAKAKATETRNMKIKKLTVAKAKATEKVKLLEQKMKASQANRNEKTPRQVKQEAASTEKE